MPIETLITDDSLFFRKILGKALGNLSQISIIGEASSGEAALEFLNSKTPQLITMDLEMPGMNGLETLKKIQHQHPGIPVVMVSAHTKRGASETIACLEEGAFGFITKPDGASADENLKYLESQLRFLISSLSLSGLLEKNTPSSTSKIQNGSISSPTKQPTSTSGASHPSSPTLKSTYQVNIRPEVIAIGVSTGGPKALSDLLPAIKGGLSVPVVICQHMPPLFTASLAETLNKKCSLTVKEAEEGELLKKSTVYIAPGGKQLKIISTNHSRGKAICLTDDPPEHNCRPAADYLFRSIANEYGSKSMGIILTGMGKDGALGLKSMQGKGAKIVAQSEETCVVFGMPKEAIQMGIVSKILPLQEIAGEINQSVV